MAEVENIVINIIDTEQSDYLKKLSEALNRIIILEENLKRESKRYKTESKKFETKFSVLEKDMKEREDLIKKTEELQTKLNEGAVSDPKTPTIIDPQEMKKVDARFHCVVVNILKENPTFCLCNGFLCCNICFDNWRSVGKYTSNRFFYSSEHKTDN